MPVFVIDPEAPSLPRSTVPVVAPTELEEDVPTSTTPALVRLDTILSIAPFSAASVPFAPLVTTLAPVLIVSVYRPIRLRRSCHC